MRWHAYAPFAAFAGPESKCPSNTWKTATASLRLHNMRRERKYKEEREANRKKLLSLTISTNVPSKWRFLDLEFGYIWKRNKNNKKWDSATCKCKKCKGTGQPQRKGDFICHICHGTGKLLVTIEPSVFIDLVHTYITRHGAHAHDCKMGVGDAETECDCGLAKLRKIFR